jgi:predicted DNA-binding transcriptional regulator YafY
MMWLLSHGPEIEVLEPASLREEVAAKLRKAAAAYDAPVATIEDVNNATEER